MAERGRSEQYNRLGQDSPEMNSFNNPSGAEASRTSNESLPTEGDQSSERRESSERRGIANRGFAAMDPEKQKRIASEGGRAAHRQGVAHEWSKDEAREAGRKGGQIVSQNRNHMSEIGRKGGQSSGQRRQRNSGSGERGEE